MLCVPGGTAPPPRCRPDDHAKPETRPLRRRNSSAALLRAVDMRRHDQLLYDALAAGKQQVSEAHSTRESGNTSVRDASAAALATTCALTPPRGPSKRQLMYTAMLQSAEADAWGRALRLAADRRHGGVLIHCQQGKDRTGVLAALLQVRGICRGGRPPGCCSRLSGVAAGTRQSTSESVG